LNLDRRHLSFEQIREIRERQKKIALELRRREKRRKKSQEYWAFVPLNRLEKTHHRGEEEVKGEIPAGGAKRENTFSNLLNFTHHPKT